MGAPSHIGYAAMIAANRVKIYFIAGPCCKTLLQ
jgi:hypothetical protein